MIARAEVVGSLLRPPHLREAREAWKSGTLPTPDFKEVEDQAVDEALDLQAAAGMDVVTDGELRRDVYIGSIAEVAEGVSQTESVSRPVAWHGDEKHQDGLADTTMEWRYGVTGKLRLRRSLVTEEFVHARSRTSNVVKVTLPSPMTLGLVWHPEFTPQVYPDVFDFFADATALVKQEAETLAALGCRYIQIDAPDLAKLVDQEGRAFYEAMGASPERILSDGMELLNSIPEGIEDVTFGMHLCRGNYRGRWRSAGGYDPIAEAVFKRASRYDTFLLEYDDVRSGGFEPLAHLPNDKIAVLGLVTTKRPELEDIDTLLARIDEASTFVPRDQLAVSPQCGFASELEGNPLTVDDQRAKLRLVAQVAKRLAES